MNRLMFTHCLLFLRREKETVVSMETVAGQWWVFSAWPYDVLLIEMGIEVGSQSVCL